MFCPKCGTQNPNGGKFCRACGTDLAVVSDALTGKREVGAAGFGMMQPMQPIQLRNPKGKSVSWESAMVKLSTGLAFLIISLILSFSPMGRSWWFWMLIPAFSLIGSAVAQIIQLKNNAPNAVPPFQSQVIGNDNSTLETGDVAQIEELVNSGRKIEAIKIHRELFGNDLREAKIAIERIGERTPQSNYQSLNESAQPLKSIYDTGELAAPPSVTEGTTRHLEINNEGETMTLPPNNK